MIIGCIVGIIIAIKNHQNGTEEVRNNVETSVDWKKYRRIAYAGLIILIIFSASVFSFRNQIQVPNSIEGVVNPSESVPLRIVSYNIRRGGSEDNPLNLWKNRKSHFVEYLNTFEADIIGVQEAFIQQVNYIVANLKPQYAYCGVGRGDGVFADEHSVILFREDKFKLMDTGTFWLSANPSVPLRTWGSACLRVCTWARFQDIPSEKQFFVFCTHFDFNGYAKTESAKLIQNVIGNYTGSLPVFLIGDFNTWSDEPAFQYLDNYGAKPLQDSYRLIHGEDYPPEYSFNDWNSSFVAEYDSRLDYIFISANIYAQNILIPKDTYGDGLTYSDHYPVVLDCIL
jgi:endonuclease/exonuclease/phosphatase family metal-dependent hydrolase